MPREDTQFKKGEGGRMKGARNKFSQAFIKDVAKSWAEHGVQTLETLREKRPDAYVKTAAALIPKDLDINHSGNINISVVDYQDDD